MRLDPRRRGDPFFRSIDMQELRQAEIGAISFILDIVAKWKNTACTYLCQVIASWRWSKSRHLLCAGAQHFSLEAAPLLVVQPVKAGRKAGEALKDM